MFFLILLLILAVGSNLALKAVGKLAPEVEQGARLVGTGASDAVGRAFKYGYKASKGATDDIAKFMTRAQQAKLGLASSNLNRLGTGVLSEDQSQELALKLIAGKRAEALERLEGIKLGGVDEASFRKLGAETGQEIARSADPVVQKLIDEQARRSGKFAKQLKLQNPYETYFPFVKKDKLANFVNSTKSIRVGSEGYTKQFKNLLTNEAIETNPAKAFFTSEAQQVTNRMNRDFLKGFVGKYGKPLTSFKNLDEAKKAGYDVLKEKGILGKELGYVSEWDAKLIKDAITPEFQTINMLAKATGFDAVTGLFKRAVTGIFPPFHIRNFTSGHVQNYEVLGAQALNPKNIAAGQKIAYYLGKGGKVPKELEDIYKPFAERFSGDTFYNADFETALNAGKELKQVEKIFSKNSLKETAKTVGLGQEAIPFKVGRAVGQFIEHSQKATAYVTALGQGKTIPQALKLAEAAGFDYRALTAFESQIMRRIVPFYSFTRKNIELQMKTLKENPQRIQHILRFFGNMGDTISEEEKKNIPEFIRESIGIKLEDSPEGLKRYISSFGTPVEAFAQLFGKNPILRGISMTNPLIKAPVEIGIGKDSFRQRDLKEVFDAKEYKMAPQWMKDMLDITPVQKDILRKDGSGKLVKVGEKTQYVADPVKLLIARSLFTSRGISYLDQVFSDDMEGFVKGMKITSGLKPQEIDLEMNKSIEETKKKRAVEDILIQKGGLNKFQTVYEKN